MRKAGKQERSAPPPHQLFAWGNGRGSELLFLTRKDLSTLFLFLSLCSRQFLHPSTTPPLHHSTTPAQATKPAPDFSSRISADSTESAAMPSTSGAWKTPGANPRPLILFILFAALLPCAMRPETLRAGPPYVTDDPEPVDLYNWEINVSFLGVHNAGGWTGQEPFLDMNYGAFHNVQLHIGPSLGMSSVAHSPFQFGIGDRFGA